ncbi:MAG: antibiotic biosynthesis monooxygenase [SAR324 cluster bacterium]|nr:antibiotic biosynthesis monooxygenase [SAR324 cluster bacterium]
MAVSLVVHLEIASEKFDEFIEIARGHGKRSLETEDGCLSFQVMISEEEANKVILVEVYQDNEALESHWKSAHMAAYLEKTGGMISNRQRFKCTV